MKKVEKKIVEEHEEKKENKYRSFYHNANTVLFNRGKARLSIYPVEVISEKGYYSYQMGIQISKLDENNKMIKTEDDRFDSISFLMNADECTKLAADIDTIRYNIENFESFSEEEKDNLHIGSAFNHVNKQTNNGTELLFYGDNDGYFITITSYKDKEAVDEYKFQLYNVITSFELTSGGNFNEVKYNSYIDRFKDILINYSGGTIDAIISITKRERSSDGSIDKNGTVNRATRKLNFSGKKHKTDISKIEEEDEDDNEDIENTVDDSEEEETQSTKPMITKKINKKPTTAVKKAKNLKSLLDEDDDD